jgi:hypothetical protein
MYDIKHIKFHFKYVKTIGNIVDGWVDSLFFSFWGTPNFCVAGF